jgi:organic radical activating enzyme
MATPSTGRPQLQLLGVLLPGSSTQLFFRLDGCALWCSSGRGTQTSLEWNDAGLPTTVVHEATASLTQLLQYVERQEHQIAELDAAL